MGGVGWLIEYYKVSLFSISNQSCNSLRSDEIRVAPILHESRLFEDVPVLPNGLSDLLHLSYGIIYICISVVYEADLIVFSRLFQVLRSLESNF